MLNHTLLSYATGDTSAREAMNNPELAPKTTDWCVGGCKSYKATKEGRERYLDLYERWKTTKTAQKRNKLKHKRNNYEKKT